MPQSLPDHPFVLDQFGPTGFIQTYSGSAAASASVLHVFGSNIVYTDFGSGPMPVSGDLTELRSVGPGGIVLVVPLPEGTTVAFLDSFSPSWLLPEATGLIGISLPGTAPFATTVDALDWPGTASEPDPPAATPGDDVLTGTDDADTIDGLEGDDQISGGDGPDRIRGSAGDDLIEGGNGKDYLFGNADDDRINGNNGDDRMDGGGGSDWLVGGRGNDLIRGGGGNDLVSGDAGNDRVMGGGGNDEVRGGLGNDKVSGQGGNDTLFGEGGRDKLFGNNGDDVIDFGEGSHIGNGGKGADTFVFRDTDAPGDRSVIRKFDVSEDRVVIEYADEPPTDITEAFFAAVTQVGNDSVWTSADGSTQVVFNQLSLAELSGLSVAGFDEVY